MAHASQETDSVVRLSRVDMNFDVGKNNCFVTWDRSEPLGYLLRRCVKIVFFLLTIHLVFVLCIFID